MTLSAQKRRDLAHEWVELPGVFIRSERLRRLLRARDLKPSGRAWGASRQKSPEALQALLKYCISEAGEPSAETCIRRFLISLGYFDPLADPFSPRREWLSAAFRLLVFLEVLPGECPEDRARHAYKTLSPAERRHVDAMHDAQPDARKKTTSRDPEPDRDPAPPLFAGNLLCSLCRGTGRVSREEDEYRPDGGLNGRER